MAYKYKNRFHTYAYRRTRRFPRSRSLLLDGLWSLVVMKQAFRYWYRRVKIISQNRWKKMVRKKLKKMLDFLLSRRYNEFRR